MKNLRIDLDSRAYDIQFGQNLLSKSGEYIKKVLPKAKKLVIVTDENVAKLYAEEVRKSLENCDFLVETTVLEAGEHTKSLKNLEKLYDNFTDFGLTRTDAVIALGGGVIGDLAGFAAATILRGVDFVQIPTTLLSQVDSSVGGKVAINLPAGKNLVGAFWQPKLVLIDSETLKSLPDSEFESGMAEVIKYGCIFDAEFFDFIAKRPTREALMADIEEILYKCCDFKRRVVVADERDTGERMLLNFGHTLGHAFELMGNYSKYNHGQAVAAGMVLVAKLGAQLSITPAELEGQIIEVCEALNLPTKIDCDLATFEAAIGLDKKGEGAKINLILLEEMGKAIAYKMPKSKLLELL